MWIPGASAPRNGLFRTDLTHELGGHALVAHHLEIGVESIVIRDVAQVEADLRVRGGCAVVWWADAHHPGNLAIMSVAGMVAELLDAGLDPREDPLGTLRSNSEFAGDLEDALRYLGARFKCATAAECEAWIPKAVDEAYTIVEKRLEAIRTVVAQYEQEVRATGIADLTIEWNDDLVRRLF
jgi:hypothetical protein